MLGNTQWHMLQRPVQAFVASLIKRAPMRSWIQSFFVVRFFVIPDPANFFYVISGGIMYSAILFVRYSASF